MVLIYISLLMSDVEHLFMRLLAICSLLWINVCWPIVLIESLIFVELSCRSCLYIFEINSLSVASFAIIFSHSGGCLFTLLIVSFFAQKLLSLLKPHLFIFAFISNILEGDVIEDPAVIYVRVFCQCFPLGVLVSGLTFRSLIHFEFIFVYGVRKCSSFILLQVVD